MSLQDMLLKAQPEIVKRWYQRVLDTYPPDTAKFLARDSDRFSNPVGQTIRPALDRLCTALIEGRDQQELRTHLDEIIRIRAVQEFTAAEAVGFMLQLKPLVQEYLGKAVQSNGAASSWDDLQRRIDGATLLAFDIYMECREQIYAIKAGSLRKRTELLLERTQKNMGGSD